ncbi:MAG: TRAP transporter permease, partial [Pseudomonadota bacterium]
MSEQSDQVIAEGIDEEPVESNRRLFSGRTQLAIAAIATVYAAFHMAALNGVSISAVTSIDIGFLPQFPLETWNFRIVHITGALALGFLIFSAYKFKDETEPGGSRRIVTPLAALLAIPAILSIVTASGFAQFLASGNAMELGGRVIWMSQAEVPEPFAVIDGE